MQRGRALDLVFAVLGAFALGTACWAIWGFLTPGDLFANGNPLVEPSLLACVLFGGATGYKFRGMPRGLVLLAAVCTVCFWLFVPDGWWATPPPGWDKALQKAQAGE
jgi:hypothetical protein